jgi:hypothetical protein
MKINFKKDGEIIDWTEQQILISHDDSLIILTNGIFNSDSFEGMSIGMSIDSKPDFSDKWKKSAFKKFYGTISNE